METKEIKSGLHTTRFSGEFMVEACKYRYQIDMMGPEIHQEKVFFSTVEVEGLGSVAAGSVFKELASSCKTVESVTRKGLDLIVEFKPCHHTDDREWIEKEYLPSIEEVLSYITGYTFKCMAAAQKR